MHLNILSHKVHFFIIRIKAYHTRIPRIITFCTHTQQVTHLLRILIRLKLICLVERTRPQIDPRAATCARPSLVRSYGDVRCLFICATASCLLFLYRQFLEQQRVMTLICLALYDCLDLCFCWRATKVGGVCVARDRLIKLCFDLERIRSEPITLPIIAGTRLFISRDYFGQMYRV